MIVSFSLYRLVKKNFSRALVKGQEMQWAMPVPSQTMSKNLSKFLQQIKNDLETTYSKKQYSPHSNFEYNYQHLKILSPL